MHKLLFASLIFSFVAASAQLSTTELDKQHLLRRIRFGERELHLPMQLENDELAVTNDRLEIKIANLENGEPDTDRVLIDQFVADQTKAAIKDATAFAQMYHLSSSPAQELVELDNKFDDANEKCHPVDAEKHPVIFTSMAEAQSACSDLRAISSAITSHHIATPQAWVSVYKEDPGYQSRTGYKLFVADTAQLRRDEVGYIDPKAKKLLIQSDRSLLIDDKQIWLTEMSEQETLEFNVKHPEYQMGDMNETLAMLTKFRQDTADILVKLRKDVRRHPEPGH
jgi:hypothetical protein